MQLETDEIKAQRRAIEESHGVDSEYVSFQHVRELFEEQVAWDGYVNVFTLHKHPHAKRCYAWSYDNRGTLKTVTVLEIPPVDSPESAVKVAIAAKARE